MLERCECINSLDKNLIIKLTNNSIDKEINEIKKIEEKGKELIKNPEEFKSYIKIRSMLIQEHETIKENLQKFKTKVENTPECR